MLRKEFPLVLRNVLFVLFIVLFVLFFYTLLHEAGHALAGILAGGSVVRLNVDFLTIGAHARVIGEFTHAQRAWSSIAGPLFPLVVWALFVLAVPRKTNPVVGMVKTLSTVGVLSTLLVWIVVPLLYRAGRAPAGEDVTNFLRYSGAPPLLVSGAALVVYGTGWGLYRLRIESVREEWGVWRRIGSGLDAPQARRTLVAMLAVWVLAVGALVGVNTHGARLEQHETTELLQGHEQIARVKLDGPPREREMLYRFTLEQPTVANLYVQMQDVRATYVDLSLISADGFQEPLLHGEEFTAGQASAQPVLSLDAGEYHVVLTSRDSAGIIAVYLKLD